MSYANPGVFASLFPGFVEPIDLIFSGSIYKKIEQEGF
jgi:hypothetical protein